MDEEELNKILGGYYDKGNTTNNAGSSQTFAGGGTLTLDSLDSILSGEIDIKASKRAEQENQRRLDEQQQQSAYNSTNVGQEKGFLGKTASFAGGLLKTGANKASNFVRRDIFGIESKEENRSRVNVSDEERAIYTPFIEERIKFIDDQIAQIETRKEIGAQEFKDNWDTWSRDILNQSYEKVQKEGEPDRGSEELLADELLKQLNRSKQVYEAFLGREDVQAGVWDGLKRGVGDGAFVPFLASEYEDRFNDVTLDAVKKLGLAEQEVVKVDDIVKKYQEGESLLSEDETVMIESMIADMFNSRIDKGVGYGLGESLVDMSRYGLEFAMTSAVLGTAGVTAKVGTTVKAIPLATAHPFIGKVMEESILSVARTGLMMPQINEKAGSYMLPEYEVVAGEKGEILLNQLRAGDDEHKAFLKAVASTYVDNLSESGGEIIASANVGKYVDNIARKVGIAVDEPLKFMERTAISKYVTKLKKYNDPALKEGLDKVLGAIKWDGVLSEVMEEELNEPLQALIEGRDYKGINTDEGKERLLMEVLTIGAFGALVNLPTKTVDSIYKRRELNPRLSKVQLEIAERAGINPDDVQTPEQTKSNFSKIEDIETTTAEYQTLKELGVVDGQATLKNPSPDVYNNMANYITQKMKGAEQQEAMKALVGVIPDNNQYKDEIKTVAQIATGIDKGQLNREVAKDKQAIVGTAIKSTAKEYNLNNPDDFLQVERTFGKSTAEKFKQGDFGRFTKEQVESQLGRKIVSKPFVDKGLEISDYKGDRVVYHGTSADNVSSIKEKGFILGSELPEGSFRGGGFGDLQKSISFSKDPKIAGRFTGNASRGAIIKANLKEDARIVSVKGVEDANELNKYVDKLREQGVDAVWIGGGEQEMVVLNPGAVESGDFKEFDVNRFTKEFGSSNILEKKVVKTKPVFSKNTAKNISTIQGVTNDLDGISPAQNTKTISKDWAGEFEVPELSKWDKFRRGVEDLNIVLKRLNSSIEDVAGVDLPDIYDLWAQKDMLPRVQSDRLRRVREKKRDFVSRIVADKISLEELDLYRRALHAKERNAKMNELRIAQGKEVVDGLSGMTDAEAEKILAKDNSRMDPYIKELRDMDIETLQFMVAEGLLKKEDAKAIYDSYKNYAPLFRRIEEGFSGIGGQGINTQKDIVKKAKGSNKEVLNTIGNTFHRMEQVQLIKLRNDIGKTIIEITKEYPFLEEIFQVEKEPVRFLGTAELTAEIDQKFYDQLSTFIQGLGSTVERQGKVNTRLGYYSPNQKKTVTKFGTSRETFAHEAGHFLDDVFNLDKRVVQDSKVIQEEIYKHSELEVGESQTRLASKKERFANAFSWWITHRHLANQTMPNFSEQMVRVISQDSKLEPLLDIKPTAKPSIESLLQDVYGKTHIVAPNVVHTKIDGENYYITVNNKDIARSLKDLNLARVPNWVKPFRTSLSIWSGFKTRWRPEFALTNFERDLGEAIVNLNVEQSQLGDQGKGLKVAVIKNLPSSQREVSRYLRGDRSNKLLDQFFADGGDTGSYWSESTQDAEDSLLKIEKELKNEGVEKIKNPVRKAGELMDNIQSSIELGVRFSAYQQLIERGMSRQKAIQSVSDLTVNFSRQGEFAPVLKSAYAFIGPAIQGTSKVARTITAKGAGKRIARSLRNTVLLGFMFGTISKMLDEEGDERISDWNKNHKLVLAVGNGGELSLWNMPYGYSTFYAIGRQMADVVWSGKDINDATGSVVDTAVNAFSPFGTSMNDLYPTLLKPLSEVEQNKSWYDSPIHPDQIFTNTPKPNVNTYFKNATNLSIFVTSLINNITGGDTEDEKAGKIDMSPNDLQYLYHQYFGGPFEFVTDSIESAGRLANGEIDPNNTPFIRQVYREGDAQQWAYSTIYDTLEIAYKKDVSQKKRDSFFRAVEIGVEEGVFDQTRANGYIREFIKATNRITGDLDSEENLQKFRAMDEDERDQLLGTYAESTRNSIKNKL